MGQRLGDASDLLGLGIVMGGTGGVSGPAVDRSHARGFKRIIHSAILTST